jgi:hypothetical protein
MTIKIEAWQSAGIKTDHKVEDYEFCCWQSLFDWLKGWSELNKCPACQCKVIKP